MTDIIQMTSNKPHLIRAFYEWILDNQLTPYLVVNADMAGVHIPRQYVEDGQIVLNITPTAAQNLLMGNEDVTFQARFSGKLMSIYVPIASVAAIYAMENGQGMVFSDDDEFIGAGIEGEPLIGAEGEPEPSPPPRGKPKLTIVK